jgi:hypothetical protein
MVKFLDTYDPPRLNKEDIHLNRSVTSNDTNAVIKSPNKEKSRTRLIAKFYQTFKEKLTPMLLKIEREEALPNSFHEASITLILKPDKDTINKSKTIDQYC